MKKRNIIVIGASAGGFEALQRLTAGLPANLDATIFIVWHMSPDITGVLPQVINRQGAMPAANAVHNEAIVTNRIYIAPPDRHLIVDQGFVRVTRGPKENRFRPAVDPLFRSAAYHYGARVIGIVLSGALDDGTAGLWTIKNRGGLAIVQHPKDALVSSMPENALRAVQVDYAIPVDEMSELLVRLTAEEVEENKAQNMDEDKKTSLEVQIAAQDEALEHGILEVGTPTHFACPECHGVLSRINDGKITRFRCHTGHAYSVDSLLTSITEKIEDTLWSAIRGVEESIMLLNNLGDHYAEKNLPKLAALYFKKAGEAETRAKLVRQAVMTHEQLTTSSISKQVDGNDEPQET